MVNPVHNHLSVEIVADGTEAIGRGFDWVNAEPVVKPIEVKKVVVVHNGTGSGKPTVDFLLEDETGQRYVFILTAALLKSIPC